MKRAKPEDYLHMIQHHDEKQDRGKLKIFFGYAAGVGKTYAMLQAAHDAKRKGVDVVCGYIEPHAREETLALLEGLEKIPPLESNHNGLKVYDFDLDGALERKPALILVDELAHTNVEKARHTKRYQDINELLAAGINVYTTVNVQHIESLIDIVTMITGVTIRETLPDSVFDEADQVEMVDIEPDELIQRMQDGKIYRPPHVNRALAHFFTKGNLTALRELSLRRTANRVKKHAEKSTVNEQQYYADETILVCLSTSPSNARIIRTAARLSAAFKGELIALYIETSRDRQYANEDRERLIQNIRLAEQLGAKVETVYGEDIPHQIAEYAKVAGVSKIVIGRSQSKKRLFKAGPSFTERVTVLAPDIDVYIIPDHEQFMKRFTAQRKKEKLTFSWRECALTIFMLIVATIVGYICQRMGFSEANIITCYILGVLITAVYTSHRLYSLASSIFAVLLFNFFFTNPTFTFMAYDNGYPVTFLFMLLASFIISTVTTRLNQQTKKAVLTASRTKILLDANQRLQQSNTREEIIQTTGQQLLKLLQKDIAIYPVSESGLLKPLPFLMNNQERQLFLEEKEVAVAHWVYKNNKRAGASTQTLQGAKCLHMAIRSKNVVYAVVAISLRGQRLDPFAANLLISVLGETGMALEKELYSRKREEAAIEAQNEHLRADLLRSISHDLRTPLTTISGHADFLSKNEHLLESDKRKALYKDIYNDSIWLINLVENLLSITRMEDGHLHLQLVEECVDDIIEETLNHMYGNNIHERVCYHAHSTLLFAKMDARLMIQVVTNLVDNALKYSPIDTTIDIRTIKNGSNVVVEVLDQGFGIEESEKEKVFDMFYTANRTSGDQRRGLGIGLALCHAIITAHDGTMSIKDNNPSGSIFRFTLPLSGEEKI
ncbi:sensor histidine kinase KdpD [Cytobacillus kochii]|uniref:sensor histidine kinase n=1 Tax=Cytobacillus kochii TaxID=859143 RepID=UPI001CD4B9D4|nr:sensor histidine kinase KdpD [Cytobacillus kochii]MCA1025876.1 sensor histidine kinase KdpD [Cytobacillus kochii]